MQMLPWIFALVSFASLVAVLAAWATRGLPKRRGELPIEWALVPRSVFSIDERRMHRLLREAFPQHVILAKLPLVRFCQPIDPARLRFWFDLLGTGQVTFAVCSQNGRVLAALDLDSERAVSRRRAQIKQAVLTACRVRYLQCPVDQPPSIAELQGLVPSGGAAMRKAPSLVPRPLDELSQARDSLAHAVASRRAERTALWQDSAMFQDSFFAPDTDSGFANSELLATPASSPTRGRPGGGDGDGPEAAR